METPHQGTALFHLPGLFEFYDLYASFLPLYRAHREYFYDWCAIGSIYGAPSDCLWAGGRVEYSDHTPREVLALTSEYGISARLTLSNSLLRPEHLTDPDCNALCRLFQEQNDPQNGAIVHAELLTQYLKKNYPSLYLVSSTTKVLTDFNDLQRELARPEFRYVVPDFRLNRAFDRLAALPQSQKDKVEFLAMSAAGSDARNAEPAMRPSAAKIWVCPARSITAAPQAQRAGIASPGRWRTPALSASRPSGIPTCRGASPNSRSRGAALAVR